MLSSSMTPNILDFVKVKILSKSNYRHYYNIWYTDVVQPDSGVHFQPNDFWSHSLPVLRNNQEHQGDVLPEVVEEGLPPPELEREGGA